MHQMREPWGTAREHGHGSQEAQADFPVCVCGRGPEEHAVMGCRDGTMYGAQAESNF